MKLEALRTLTFDRKSPEMPAHLAAASGLAKVGGVLCVVADDDLHLGLFSENDQQPGRCLRLLPGRLPAGHAKRKLEKPDFELLVQLPPFTGYEAGALLALGSGSTERRLRGVLLALEPDGRLSETVTESVDFAPIFRALRDRVPELNVEGAVVAGERLLLFQRGNGAARQNAVISLHLKSLLQLLGEGAPLSATCVEKITPVALGEIGGVSLGFTDALLLPDGNVLYSAVAEEVESTLDDGPCTGAVLGTLSVDGKLLRQETLEPAVKVEGICLSQPEGDKVLLVVDADDPTAPATLYQTHWR